MGGERRDERQPDPSRAPIEVLYVDADRSAARAVAEALRASGPFTVETRTTPDAALAVLETRRVDAVVAADDSETGLDFRRAVRTVDPAVPFVLVAESDSVGLVREALSVGVDGYLTRDESSDALAATLRTVVSEHRAMQASVSSRLVLDSLSHESPVLGVVVAPDGTVRHLTESVTTTTGVDGEQSLGTPLWTLPWWPADDATPTVESCVERAARGDAVTFQGPLECGDETRTVLWTLLPVRSGPTVDSILLTGVDITPLVRHGTQLERQNRRLDEFSSVVSHDLRSPLSVASGHLELASRECDSDHLDHATMALSRMEQLIDELRTVARQGRVVGDLTDVALSTIVTNAWASVETGDARLVIDGDLTVRCDETRLWQLFENFFRNAIEHGTSDTAAATARDDGPLTVTVGPLEDGFFVEDTGIGIPADEHATVFEMGYSSTPDGTGFGLAIVEGIVRAHRWEIAVGTGSDGGARFEITGVETAADLG